MSIKVASNRLIVSSLNRYAGFYQQLTSKVSSFKELGNRLVIEAEAAQAFLQLDKLEDVALVLSSSPIKEYRLIGQYYLGWCAFSKSEDARSIFERVVEESETFKARALISLSAIEPRNGDYTSELSYLSEAVKCAATPSATLSALRGVAVIKSIEGFHKTALSDLEKLGALAHYANPLAYYEYLNSLAVEFCEAGRIQEARNICRHVLASPFAFAYPEWRETSDEIELRGYKSRSAVSVVQPASENVVQLPVPDTNPQPVQTKPARILNYAEFKKKMGKENGEEQNIDEMSDKDIFMEIMHLSSQETITRKQLQQILDSVKKIVSKKD